MVLKMGDHSKFSVMRIALCVGLFLSVILLILLVSSQSPFGIDLSESKIKIAQVVKTQPVSYKESYKLKRDFIGQVEASQTSQLGFEISGQIETMFVDEGDFVNKDQVLASLDTDRLNTEKDQAEAALKSAIADANLASDTFDRISNARKLNAVSPQDKDEAQQTKDSALANVKASQAQLDTINVNIEKSTLKAPYDGVIIMRSSDQGAVIGSGQAIMALEKKDVLEARFGLSAKMLERIKIGQEIVVYKGETPINAMIKSIIPSMNSVRSFDIIMRIQSDEQVLRTGDILKLPLEEIIEKRGFWVANEALREGNRGLWSLYVAEKLDQDNDLEGSHQAVQRNVEIIDAQSGRSFVNGSVDDGEAVIVKGAHKLVPDQPIRITDETGDFL